MFPRAGKSDEDTLPIGSILNFTEFNETHVILRRLKPTCTEKNYILKFQFNES